MAEVVLHLSREEKLAIWREEKNSKQKKRVSSTSSGPSHGSKQKESPNAAQIQKRTSLATSYGSIKQTPNRGIAKPSPATRSTGQPPRYPTPRFGVDTTSKTSPETARIPLSSLSTNKANSNANANLATSKTTFVSTRNKRKPLFKISPTRKQALGPLTTPKALRHSLGKPVRLSVSSVQDAHSSDHSDTEFDSPLQNDEAGEDDEVSETEIMVGTQLTIVPVDAVSPMSPLSWHSRIFESPYRAASRLGGVIHQLGGHPAEEIDAFSVEAFVEAETENIDCELEDRSPTDGGRQQSGNISSRSKTHHFGWQDDSPEITEQKFTTRKRRADSLYLLLPKPSPIETSPPLQVASHEETVSPVNPSPSFLGTPSVQSAFHRISPKGSTKTLFGVDERDPSECGTLLLDKTVRLNNAAILEPIVEIAHPLESTILTSIHPLGRCTSCNESAALRLRVATLMQEKQILENRLSNIRRAYEQRVTPFRDVFEISRKLQMENRILLVEKEATQASVKDLEEKMMTGLIAAVQKTTRLQGMLANATQRNEELEQELCRLQIDK